VDQQQVKRQTKKIKKEDFENLSEYLNETEKDYFYSLMGLVNQNFQKERDHFIFSIEYLLEIKCKSEKPRFKNLAINSQVKKLAEKATNLEDLQNILSIYNAAIQNKIIISEETYEELVNITLKY
jgi:hypothetical protein